MGAHPAHSFAELIAGHEGDELLHRIAQNWRPPCTSAELEAVRRDALRAIAKLPDPALVAWELETGEPELAEALRQAYIGQRQPNAGWWRVHEGPHVAPLRSMGLVEAGDFGLMVSGNIVRKHLLGLLP